MCINQDDTEERNDQVGLMKDIYSRASECFVYLGKGDDTYRIHEQKLANLKTFIEWYRRPMTEILGSVLRGKASSLRDFDLSSFLSLSYWRETFWSLVKIMAIPVPEDRFVMDSLKVDAFWKLCIRDIASQEFFERIWMVQEIVLSRRNTCLWGSCVFDWDVVCACALEIPLREGLAANVAFKRMPGILSWSHPAERLVDKYFLLFKGRPGKFGLHAHPADVRDPILALDWSKGSNARAWEQGIDRLTKFVQLTEFLKKREERPLLDILKASRFLKAGNSRDKIFGILGLASDAAAFPKPDYSRDVDEVFRHFATAFIHQGWGVEALCLSGLQISPVAFPSWIPRWHDIDLSWHFQSVSSFRACSRAAEIFETVYGLRIAAGIFDEIVMVCQPLKGLGDFTMSQRLAAYCQEALRQLGVSDVSILANDLDYRMVDLLFLDFEDLFPKNEAIADAIKTFKLRDVLLSQDMRMNSEAKFRPGEAKEPSSHPFNKPASAALWKIELSRLLPKGKTREEALRAGEVKLDAVCSSRFIRVKMRDYLERGTLDYIQYLAHIEKSARIVKTRRGHIGLASAATRVADSVAVIRGARTPFVLRPVGGSRYQNVGQAYIRGVMYGEAMEEKDFRFQKFEIV